LAAAISVYPFITGLKFPQDKARLVIPEYVLSNSDAIEKSVNGELMLLPSVPAFNYRWSWSGLLDPLFYTTTNALLYTGSQVGSENTTPNKGWLFDSFAERLYAPDGTTAAKRILDWIHPQAILQRDDINQDFYGKGKDTPELIKKSLASIGLSDPDPKVISPWHLYHTGMAHQPVKLNNNVVFTTEKPTKLLQYLAELGQLEPETTFITDEDNMTKVENAGIAHKRIYRVDADTAGPVESNKASLAFQVPSGSYQFYIKQSEAHLPPVTIAGKSISMQKVSDQWWQSDPVAVDGKQSTIETENPKSNQEHVMTFNMHNAWSVEDVGPPPPGQVIPSNFRQDSISEEKNGIDLQSTGHKLMFKTSLTNMEVGHLYQLNFDYKTDENMPGEFSVFMTGTGRIALNEGLPAHTQWQHISRAFRMEPGADVVNVNIFGFTSIPGKVANQFYRNVSVREIVPIESVLIEELTKQPQQQIKVTQPALIKQTPTVAIASIPERTQTEILSYDQNYSPQWLLSGLAGAVPIRTNWYGTAWIIPAGTASKVSLAYSVQRWFSVGLAVSAISLLELVLWFVIHSRVRRHEKSQPD